jgi:structural maintenance of chromosome 3 (chondroitin sulfate proteoglycan 6)
LRRENCSSQHAKLTALQTELATLAAQVEDYTAEVATPLQANLTDAERQQLSDLQQQEKELELQKQQCQRALDEIATEMEQLNAHMNQNLMKQRQDLLAKLGADSAELEELDDEVELNGLRNELGHAKRQLEKLQQGIEAVDRDWAGFTQTKEEREKEVEELRAHEARLQAVLDEFVKQQESLFNKRTMLTQTRDQKIRLIHELGTLPVKEVEEAKDLSHRELLKRLKEVNQQLKRFSHVNKKALDQYVNFSEQRNLLLERKQELDRECESIKKLIQTLDR